MKTFIAAPFGNYIKTSNTISVTGSWTIEKRNGRIKQIVKTLRYTKKGWINKIGLRNPGFDYGINKHKKDEVFSIAGIENFSYDTRQWYIGKISPLTTFDELEKYISEFNFKQIHACNTLPIDRGGLSGKELVPYTSKFIMHIKEYYPHIEIIAGGGISEKEDIKRYIDLGADHISLGTVCFNPVKLGRLL